MRRSVVRPKLVSKKCTSGMRISRRVIAAIFISASVGPALIPFPKHELPIALLVAFVAKHRQAARESVEKELAIARLHGARLVASLWIRLPFINLRGNFDAQLGGELRRNPLLQQFAHTFGAQPPLGYQAVAR